MPIDADSLPISGGLVLALVAGAAISAFALGPLVAKRTIEVSGWQQNCARDLTAASQPSASAPARPEISCDDLAQGVGGLVGLDAR